MAIYSIQDIADARGYSYDATRVHLKKLRDTNKFEKTGVGIYYNDADIKNLEELLGFTMPKKKNGSIPRQTRLDFRAGKS